MTCCRLGPGTERGSWSFGWSLVRLVGHSPSRGRRTFLCCCCSWSWSSWRFSCGRSEHLTSSCPCLGLQAFTCASRSASSSPCQSPKHSGCQGYFSGWEPRQHWVWSLAWIVTLVWSCSTSVAAAPVWLACSTFWSCWGPFSWLVLPLRAHQWTSSHRWDP